MRSSLARIALVILTGAAISSCSDTPIAPLKKIETPTPQMSMMVPPPAVVISQVYSGGGSSNVAASYQTDFVELFNPNATASTITGYRLSYASSAGSSWSSVILPTATIPAGGYYLVKLGSAGSGGAVLQGFDHSSTSINMGAAAGKIVLTSGNTVSGICPVNVLDHVGYGGTNCVNPPAPNVSWGLDGPAGGISKAIARKDNGCTFSNVAGADFEDKIPPAPRNSLSTPYVCGTVNEDPVLTGVDVTASPSSVIVGNPVTVTAQALAGTQNASATYAWSFTSSPANAVSLSSTSGGSITVSTLLAGSATIIATATNSKGSAQGQVEITIEVPPPPPAPVVITEINGNPSVSGDVGEWFEIYNPTEDAVSIQGWKLVSSEGGTPFTHTISANLSIPAKGFVVLGNNANTSTNGGVSIDYQYAGITFSNSTTTDFIELQNGAGVTADRVNYNGTTMTDGVAREVIDPNADNLLLFGGFNWIDSGAGTPGAGTYNLPRGPAATVTVTANPAYVATGGTRQLNAIARDAQSLPVATPFTWSSSNTAVATVNASGLVSGITAGDATISATSSNGTVGSLLVRVLAPGTPAYIVLSMNTPRTLPVGYTKPTFITSVRDASDADVPCCTAVTWSTDDANVATVDQSGYATAVGVGQTRVVATSANGASGSVTLTVIDATAPHSAVYGNHVEFGVPTDASPADDQVINRAQFSTSYSSVRGGPNWVSWTINASQFGSAPRCDCFTTDPVAGGSPVADADYRNGGYDRGHMVQSESRTATLQENASTFLLTNILPQAAATNQGAWSKFENYLNNLARNDGKQIYVIAGGEYAPNAPTLKNEGKVAIPHYTWKVAVIMDAGEGLADFTDLNSAQVIAIRMPNLVETAPAENSPWEPFQVKVDDIEAATGYDVLALLADQIEIAVESQTKPPVAHAGGSYSGNEGSTISFNGAASSDPDAGQTLTYSWNFGDGGSATGATPSHTYTQDGAYTVTLTVTDDLGLTDVTTTTVNVSNVGPVVNAFAGATLLPGETYSATGSFVDPGADAFSGTVDYGDGNTGALNISGHSFALSHTYSAAGSYTVTVVVADDDTQASGSAVVSVLTQAQGIEQLITMVGQAISGGNANSLRAKLNAAANSLGRGAVEAATGQLNAFVNEVNALESAGRLSAADAAALRTYALRIIAAL